MLEELGLAVEPGPLLVVDWAPSGDQDRVLFIFDGGSLGSATIRLQASELRDYRYVEPGEVPAALIPRPARRVSAALDARERGVTLYLEHGPGPVSQVRVHDSRA